jgi:hypothetical protein
MGPSLKGHGYAVERSDHELRPASSPLLGPQSKIVEGWWQADMES